MVDHHDPVELAREVLALEKGTTPGPWKLWGMEIMSDPRGTSDIVDARTVAMSFYRDENDRPRTFDASFIAHTRTSAPALARAVITLTEERDRLRALLAESRSSIAVWNRVVVFAAPDFLSRIDAALRGKETP